MAFALSRRLLLKSAAATALLPLAGHAAFAATTTIDVMTDGDTNISDWWTNTLKPAFEKANPEFTLNVVITRANGSNQVFAQRLLAAKQTNTDPKVYYFEEFEPHHLPGAIDGRAFQKLDDAHILN